MNNKKIAMKKDNLKSQQHTSPTTSTTSTPQEFTHAIAKLAVAQICKSAGFKSFKLSALEAFTAITTTYLQSVAKSAASYANAANRTQSNLIDLTNALHDHNGVPGFVGASSLHCSDVGSSSLLREIAEFVRVNDEIPFVKAIPARESLGSEKREGNYEGEWKHIPEWLPRLPDRSAYDDKEECEGSFGCFRGFRRVCVCSASDTENGFEGKVGGQMVGKGSKGGELPMKRRLVKYQEEDKCDCNLGCFRCPRRVRLRSASVLPYGFEDCFGNEGKVNGQMVSWCGKGGELPMKRRKVSFVMRKVSKNVMSSIKRGGEEVCSGKVMTGKENCGELVKENGKAGLVMEGKKKNGCVNGDLNFKSVELIQKKKQIALI